MTGQDHCQMAAHAHIYHNTQPDRVDRTYLDSLLAPGRVAEPRASASLDADVLFF